MKKSFKQLMKEEKKPVGIFVNTGCPEMVEITAQTGFRFVFIDNEHGSWGLETNADMIRAAESFDSIPLIRVPVIDETAIKYALDCGAAGVVIPGVSTPEQAVRALEYSKFAPEGKRGACPYVRANRYTGRSDTYFEESNRETAVVMLIEGEEGVANYDAILEVEGVEFVFFGPYDLSVSLGIPGQLEDPRVKKSIREMIRKANEKGIYAGMLGIEAKDSNEWFACGADYIVAVGDMALFYRTCQEMVNGIRARS